MIGCRAIAMGAVLVCAAVTTTGCTGAAAHDGHRAGAAHAAAPASPHPTSAVPEMRVKAFAAKAGSTDDDASPIATASGTIDSGDTTVKMVAEVLSVTATGTQTRLVWRLKTASGGTADTSTFQMSRAPLFDTRYIALEDTATGKKYYPYTYAAEGQTTPDAFNSCLCSDIPFSIDGTGVVLSALMPPLPPGSSTVDVAIPGFDAMTNVAVTARS